MFERLEEICGPVDLMSRWLSFDFTDYYFKEMGAPLYRRMVAFQPLMEQSALASIKLQTNTLEQSILRDGAFRQVNIDPGYLLPSRFVLATGKEYSHRIYIGKQIYADLTLMYTKQGFKTLEWTYPDYASKPVLKFLSQVRQKYLLDLQEHKQRP
ncbi:MAG: GTP-binding protein [Desulfobacterales bacterium]|nr:MAG: GTP-binding protein [Desulfobacterales bacterium]